MTISPIYSTKSQAQYCQRELLKQAIGDLRYSNMSYLIKSAEGFGKTTWHFLPVEDEMLDIAKNQFGEDSARPRFGCFAFRSYEQAEQKASEFRDKSMWSRATVIKSFNAIYREFCEQENETPIDKDDVYDDGLRSYLRTIRAQQPRVFELLEHYRTGLWADNQFDGGTMLFSRMPSSTLGPKIPPPEYGFTLTSTLIIPIRSEDSRIRSLSKRWFLTSLKSTNSPMCCPIDLFGKSKELSGSMAIGENEKV